MMARKGRKLVLKLKVSESLALSTLGAGSMIVGDFDDVVVDSTFLISIEVTASMGGHTGGEGPLVFGVAHSDYTQAEITEWFAATSNWDQGDLVAQEQAKRKIRQIGEFSGVGVGEVLNNGNSVKIPLRFYIEEGDTLQTWVLNQDAGALTTGTLIALNGQVWARRA